MLLLAYVTSLKKMIMVIISWWLWDVRHKIVRNYNSEEYSKTMAIILVGKTSSYASLKKIKDCISIELWWAMGYNG